MNRPCSLCHRLFSPAALTRGRCVACGGRATPAQRGYGTAHRNARAALAETLPAPCGYCRVLIGAGERWVAAHVRDGDPTAGWMAAHPACNERAKARGRRLVAA